jgi:hypothetical protein
MNKIEAHDLLDRRKQGLAVPQYLINRALVVSGDISMACLPCKATRVESTGMAQGEGTGVMPYGSVEWDNQRLSFNYEGKE